MTLVIVTSRYSFALTSISLKVFPFLYELSRGSLNISFSNAVVFEVRQHRVVRCYKRQIFLSHFLVLL